MPIILNVYDGYMFGANTYDLAVEVEEAFDQVCAMSWCHQSQIAEWLPWVGRHHMRPPDSQADWSKILRRRFLRRNRELEIKSTKALEVFTVTAWGEIPDYQQLLADFPKIHSGAPNLARLKKRLATWQEH
jgi:hypothetical protein